LLQEEAKKEILVVEPNGMVQLPRWVWKRLLKMSRIRSRKKRHQKKAIKKQFMKLIREYFEQNQEG
jgi:t-SNARE complex subunit (syntaxin)